MRLNILMQAGAVLATFLWVTLVRTNVIVTIIVEEKDDGDAVEDLKNILTKVGAVVTIMEKEDDIGCVLMAQTARMLAFNLPMVSLRLQLPIIFPGFR